MIELRRRGYTLLEILLVLAIVATIGSVLAINVLRAIEQQKFYSSVDVLVDRLQMAQDLMLLMDRDARVSFEQRKEGLYVRVLVDGALPPLISRMAQGTVLKGIASSQFIQDGNLIGSPFQLVFLSRGTVMSRGQLRFSSFALTGQSFKAQIDLSGNPQPMIARYIERFGGDINLLQPGGQYEQYPIEIQQLMYERQGQKK